MDTRQLKALEIAARCKIAFTDGAWRVPSQASPAKKYRVTLSPVGCNCEDFALRQEACKHVIAAQLVSERDGLGKAPLLDTDVLPVRPTYKQNWPAYNLAQSQERRRFQSLLADLCRGISEPPPRAERRGRQRHLYRDAVFCMAYKVYGTFSSRRSACDFEDSHERGHITRPVPGMKVSSFFENPDFTPILRSLITRSSLPLRAVETTFAPDSTGFSTGRFVRWYDEKYGAERSGRDWVKVHAICGVKTNIVTAVEILDRDAADCPQFKPLVEATAASGFTVKEVVADKAYLSNANLDQVDGLGATAFIPFKSNSTAGEAQSVWEKMFAYYAFRHDDFLTHYHQRSNIESTFSMIKRKLGDSLRSKTDTAMKNEALCKFLAHNICCVIQSQCELGIEATFWGEERADEPRDVLPLVRLGKS